MLVCSLTNPCDEPGAGGLGGSRRRDGKAVTGTPESRVRIPALPPIRFVPGQVSELPLSSVSPAPAPRGCEGARGQGSGGVTTCRQGLGNCESRLRSRACTPDVGVRARHSRQARRSASRTRTPDAPEAPSSLVLLGPLGSGRLCLGLQAHMGTGPALLPLVLVMLQSPKVPFSGKCPPALSKAGPLECPPGPCAFLHWYLKVYVYIVLHFNCVFVWLTSVSPSSPDSPRGQRCMCPPFTILSLVHSAGPAGNA